MCLQYEIKQPQNKAESKKGGTHTLVFGTDNDSVDSVRPWGIQVQKRREC